MSEPNASAASDERSTMQDIPIVTTEYVFLFAYTAQLFVYECLYPVFNTIFTATVDW